MVRGITEYVLSIRTVVAYAYRLLDLLHVTFSPHLAIIARKRITATDEIWTTARATFNG